MALAHQIHRHSRNEDHDDDHYAGPDMAGVEVIAAGSVTSFVRKLFQMVQGECDSVVGFVADGTAFEVKDPRRLEQDILPKYFRHSRFQSLVRQLNFYSFKKISKERSVWIYKHAFFRRDEPELLHALKRKTNQHGAPGRIGGVGGGGVVAGDGGDDAGLDRPMVPSLSREAHDSSNNKPRPRGPNLSRLPSNSSFSGHQQQQQQHHHHHTGPSSFNNTGSGRHQSSSSSSTSGRQPNHHHHHHQNQNHHQHHHHNQQQQQAPPPHHQHHLSSHHAGKGGSGRSHLSSNSRGGSAGGGPSTGGVGGAAVPSYGGQGPSSRVPGFAWSGAGGRPVSAGGGASADYADSGGDGNGGDEAQHRGARGWASSTATGHRDSHSQHNHHSSQHHHHNNNNNNQHGGGGGDGSESVAAAGGMAPSHGYRQGPAMGDTVGGEEHGGNDNDDGGRHGVKRRTAAAATIAAATSAAGTGTGSPGRDQASALWGLSALCKVASATEDPADEETREGVRGGRSGLESEGRQPKRPCVADEAGVMRRGWGSAGGGRHGEGSSEEDEGEEDGITSAERDDSSASLHSRSPSSSSCGSSRSSNSSGGDSARGGRSPRRGSGSSPGLDHDGVVVASVGSGDGEDDDEGRQGEGSALTNGAGIAPYTTSGSRGVFCPTWDWGRAACEPAIRLPGSFADRRGEREGQGRRAAAAAGHGGVAEGFEMEVEEDEESSKTEGEDIDDEEDHETVCGAKEVHGVDAAAAAASSGEQPRQASSACTSAIGGTPAPHTLPACPPPRPRDLEADIEAEAAVGLEGIGAMFAQFCASRNDGNDSSNASESVFLATVTNSDDGGLREMAVFCAGPAGQAPDVAPPALLARLVSSFLQAEGDVAEDLRIYAEALDPAAVDVVVTGRAMPSPKEREAKELPEAVADPTTADPKHEGSATPSTDAAVATATAATATASASAAAVVVETPPLMDAQDGAKLLRVFCRYAACRLGRALEVASSASASTMVAAPERRSDAAADGQDQQLKKEEEGEEEEMRHRFVARRVSPQLDECRWKWWRAAVRFS